ncbi:executer 1 [Dionaea muscipula]
MAAPIPAPATFPSMASLSDQRLFHPCPFGNPSFILPLQKLPQLPRSLSYSNSISHSHSSRCHSHGPSSGSLSPPEDRGWDSSLLQFVKSAAQKFDAFVKSSIGTRLKDPGEMTIVEGGELEGSGGGEVEDQDWNWDRWMKHFLEVEEQERLISLLKSQLVHAVDKEDYADAARLKVAIAAMAMKDTVGRVMSYLNRAIVEERYRDAAFVRDNAGVGLVGWWAGISEDGTDPYGYIVRISADHGRYIARSYSARQLATATSGPPLFEIFLTLNKKGEYKHQAVYLKRKVQSRKLPSSFPRSSEDSNGMNGLKPTRGKSDIVDPAGEDNVESIDRDGLDVVDEQFGFQNFLQDIIPDVNIEVLKVDDPQKVDLDSKSKMIELIIDEDYDEKESEMDNADIESRDRSGEELELGMHSGSGIIGGEDGSGISIEVVIGGPMQNAFSTQSTKDLLRFPAKLEKSGHNSFCFAVENVSSHVDSSSTDKPSTKRKAKRRRRGVSRRAEHIVLELVKFVTREEIIPQKLLKDVKDLINSSLSQAQDRPLTGSTTFNRIELPALPDPLSGLYIGSNGPFTSEVIQLRRKFGQWQGDHGSEVPSDIEFYEYVEAVKLTGDPYLPAGQVTFRAKVGKRYQLPHKGIIPEEFSVIARYKGQGKVAEPGFENPRWVDGELIILDGKYIKAGPVIGFVYWDPQYPFLVFFNRLRLEQ